jgi:diketogulonate reductase-like aldo/keto reductase
MRWVVQNGVVAVTASTEIAYDKEDLNVFDFELTEDEMALLKKK